MISYNKSAAFAPRVITWVPIDGDTGKGRVSAIDERKLRLADAEIYRTILRKRSWPAVSQSWRRTLTPFTMTFFATKKAPVVDVVFLGSNLF